MYITEVSCGNVPTYRKLFQRKNIKISLNLLLIHTIGTLIVNRADSLTFFLHFYTILSDININKTFRNVGNLSPTRFHSYKPIAIKPNCVESMYLLCVLYFIFSKKIKKTNRKINPLLLLINT